MKEFKKTFFIVLFLSVILAVVFSFLNGMSFSASIKTVWDIPADSLEIVAEPSDTLNLTPSSCPSSAPWELFKPYHIPETNPTTILGFKHETQINGELGAIHFKMPEDYSNLGITSWRANNFRNQSFLGTVDVIEEKLEVRYSINVGNIGTWTGVGWSGQPAIVKWDFEVQKKMNLLPGKKEKEGLVEVICGALDGKIHFFDLEDGKPTRSPIVLNAPIKGGVTIDPRGYPLLYVGQGVKGNISRFGFYIFSLINGSELFFINGRDSFALRPWAAFDANPLIDADSDRMILAGENGVIYNVLLNTNFDIDNGTISIEPLISRYRYSTNPIRRWVGIEGSVSAFSHYLFTGDNSGVLQCIDMRTFEPVWVQDNMDDTDAALVLDWEDEHQRLVIYAGTEVDLQGDGGFAYIRKYDASNGAILWEHKVPCHYHTTNGGVLATPVVGQNDISNLVIYFVGKVKNMSGAGLLIAYDRESGQEVWRNVMQNYGWSSPVAIYTPEGKSYLIVSNSVGDMYLINGIDGKVISKINLGGNIEASAVVYDNMLVVGTRGRKIFGIEIK